MCETSLVQQECDYQIECHFSNEYSHGMSVMQFIICVSGLMSVDDSIWNCHTSHFIARHSVEYDVQSVKQCDVIIIIDVQIHAMCNASNEIIIQHSRASAFGMSVIVFDHLDVHTITSG